MALTLNNDSINNRAQGRFLATVECLNDFLSYVKYILYNVRSKFGLCQFFFVMFFFQIHLHNSNYSACEASLENGLSYNFEVKDSPIYHIIKAKTQKKQKLYEDALNTLTVAMNLRGMKRTGRSSLLQATTFELVSKVELL